MVRGLGFVLSFLFLCLEALGKPSADRFRSVYDAFISGEETKVDSAYLSRFDYLFFGGFGGIKFKPFSLIGDGYFDLFRQEVRRHGVPKQQVPSTYFPPSSKSIAENGEGFFSDVLYERVILNGRKVVLFGHSKGAAELFTFAVTNPEFVRDHVEALIFISGAFQGSALANLVQGKANRRPVPLALHVPSRAVALAMWPYLNFFWRNGLNSLTTEAAGRHLEKILKDEYAVKEVLAKSLFVQTETKGLDRSPIIWMPDLYLRTEGADSSDGLVTLSHQLPTESAESVILSGVSHFVPCPKIISWHYFSRIPRGMALASLASLQGE